MDIKSILNTATQVQIGSNKAVSGLPQSQEKTDSSSALTLEISDTLVLNKDVREVLKELLNSSGDRKALLAALPQELQDLVKTMTGDTLSEEVILSKGNTGSEDISPTPVTPDKLTKLANILDKLADVLYQMKNLPDDKAVELLNKAIKETLKDLPENVRADVSKLLMEQQLTPVQIKEISQFLRLAAQLEQKKQETPLPGNPAPGSEKPSTPEQILSNITANDLFRNVMKAVQKEQLLQQMNGKQSYAPTKETGESFPVPNDIMPDGKQLAQDAGKSPDIKGTLPERAEEASGKSKAAVINGEKEPAVSTGKAAFEKTAGTSETAMTPKETWKQALQNVREILQEVLLENMGSPEEKASGNMKTTEKSGSEKETDSSKAMLQMQEDTGTAAKVMQQIAGPIQQPWQKVLKDELKNQLQEGGILPQEVEEMEKSLAQMLASMENTEGEGKLSDSKTPSGGRNLPMDSSGESRSSVLPKQAEVTQQQSAEKGRAMPQGAGSETQMDPAAEKGKVLLQAVLRDLASILEEAAMPQNTNPLLEPSLEKMNLPKAVFTMSAFLDALKDPQVQKFIYDPSNPMPENLRELVKRLPEETQQTLVKYMLENKDMLLRDKTMLANAYKDAIVQFVQQQKAMPEMKEALPQSLMETLQRMSESPEGEIASQGMGMWPKLSRTLADQLNKIVNAYETAAAVKEEAAGQNEKNPANAKLPTADIPVLTNPKLREAIKDLPQNIQQMINKELMQGDKEGEKLQQIAKNLQDITTSYQKSTVFQGNRAPEHTLASLSLPLYLGDGTYPYPAYIHVYHQEEEEKGAGGATARKDTWLRICLTTENMGMVDAAFHLHDKELLNVRVVFTDSEGAEMFRNYIPEIRQNLGDGPITLADFTTGIVSKEWEKM